MKRARAFGGALVLAAGLTSVWALAQTPTFEAAAFGGVRGSDYAPHNDGDTFEYSELATVDFTQKLDYKSLVAHLTITPQTPYALGLLGGGTRLSLAIRKTPGVTYTIGLSPGLRSTDGATLAHAVAYHLTTPAEPKIPAPLRATPGEPYRYGVLAHPFADSLAGPNADRLVAAFAAAGMRFVRIDYCGAQNLGDGAQKSEPDFTVQDAILDKLVARGMTELPIVDQYCAPKWTTGGKPYPAIYNDPADYARYAGAIAAHLAAKYPKVTRMELFNEPNLIGWWDYTGTDELDGDQSGRSAARYMKAAYAAIKQAAPHMTVAGPALADGGHDVDPRAFFRALYAAGCRRGACWDVISVHNYRWCNPDFDVDPSAQNRFDVYKDLQAIATQNGDPGTHVMLTEWAYSSAPMADGFDPRVQALYIALGLNRMLADRSVDGIVYYGMYSNGKAGSFWVDTRLIDADFTTSPGYDVFKRFASR